MDLRVNAYLPEEYVADGKQRMEMYKRIASVVTDDDRADITDELIDRFGELPEVVQTLLDVSQLRALCNRIGVSRVLRTKTGLTMKLDERYIPDIATLFRAVAETDARLSFGKMSAASLVLRTETDQEALLLTDGLKVMKKLIQRYDELTREEKGA